MKGLRVAKIVKPIKFENVGGELESKNCFQRKSFNKICETDSSFHVKLW